MFDNVFSPSPATWTALIAGLVALPLLIHLINLVRHRRIEWAAMEFLLNSHQKNRNWVWLKQLLLLLSRIATLLLVLFMLAQIGCREDRIARLLGGATTHHYVLLDDSFSMSDRASDATAFERARATLTLIAARARNRQNQRYTLLRFSQAAIDARAATGQTEIELSADLNGELVDNLFERRLQEAKAGLVVSNLACGPLDALETAGDLIAERQNENAIVYVLSDFRAKDWEAASDVDNQLMQIHQLGAAIELVACVKTSRPNLAVTQLRPVGHVRAAATPLMMGVTIRNYSSTAAQKIQVRVAALSYDQPADRTALADVPPRVEDLPTVFVESIPAAAAETRRFPVYFNKPGQHVVFVQLADDAVKIDNQHWNVTRFSNAARVLLIDDQQQLHSGVLNLALNPGGMTGITPEFRTKDFLRDSTAEQLDDFDVIFLLDIDRLDDAAISRLEDFARAGGGVAFFLGPKTNLAFYNDQLYRQGQGIFPLPLDSAVDVPEMRDGQLPDIVPLDHPIFGPLLSLKQSPLDLVQLKRIIQPPPDWNPNDFPQLAVAATVQGKKSWPLVVTSRWGNGQVAVITTTAGPVWNNWTRNGTFPPILLLLEDFLAAGRYQSFKRLVGSPIELAVSKQDLLSDVTFAIPSGTEGSSGDQQRLTINRAIPPANESTAIQSIRLGNDRLDDPLIGDSGSTACPGIYDFLLTSTDGNSQLHRFALNVDSGESDLRLAGQQPLMARLDAVKPNFSTWDQFSPEPKRVASSLLSKLLLLALILLLIGEQCLAYSASYHAKSAPTNPIHSHRRVLA